MSLNAGAEIYNKAIVTGKAPDGTDVLQAVFADPDSVPDAQLVASSNPTFATNTTGWTASAPSVITRDTVNFDTAPASGRWDRSPGLLGLETLTHPLVGKFLPGVLYTATVRVSGSSPTDAFLGIKLGTATDFERITVSLGNAAPPVWLTFSISWMPDTIGTTADYQLICQAVMPRYYVDSFSIVSTGPTLVSRRGFLRSMQLPINNLDGAGIAAKALGEIWLGNHTTTPQRGSVSVTGDQGIRETMTGQGVPPGVLLTRTGEIIRFMDRVDPDTGALGRDGRIAAVSYVPATQTATITIDNQRDNLSALLSRMAVVVDNTRAS
jgi:hypothetical protein